MEYFAQNLSNNQMAWHVTAESMQVHAWVTLLRLPPSGREQLDIWHRVSPYKHY
jgi:hypothetical protein